MGYWTTSRGGVRPEVDSQGGLLVPQVPLQKACLRASPKGFSNEHKSSGMQKENKKKGRRVAETKHKPMNISTHT